MLTKQAPILTHDVNVSPYDEGYTVNAPLIGPGGIRAINWQVVSKWNHILNRARIIVTTLGSFIFKPNFNTTSICLFFVMNIFLSELSSFNFALFLHCLLEQLDMVPQS